MRASAFDSYRRWANAQVCRGCGAKASERPRDENGHAMDIWFSETECMACAQREMAKRWGSSTFRLPEPHEYDSAHPINGYVD